MGSQKIYSYTLSYLKDPLCQQFVLQLLEFMWEAYVYCENRVLPGFTYKI